MPHKSMIAIMLAKFFSSCPMFMVGNLSSDMRRRESDDKLFWKVVAGGVWLILPAGGAWLASHDNQIRQDEKFQQLIVQVQALSNQHNALVQKMEENRIECDVKLNEHIRETEPRGRK